MGARREEGVGARNEVGMDPILLVHTYLCAGTNT